MLHQFLRLSSLLKVNYSSSKRKKMHRKYLTLILPTNYFFTHLLVHTLLHFFACCSLTSLTQPSLSSTFAVRLSPWMRVWHVLVSGTIRSTSTLSPWIQIRTGRVDGRNSVNGKSKDKSKSSPAKAMCAVQNNYILISNYKDAFSIRWVS